MAFGIADYQSPDEKIFHNIFYHPKITFISPKLVYLFINDRAL